MNGIRDDTAQGTAPLRHAVPCRALKEENTSLKLDAALLREHCVAGAYMQRTARTCWRNLHVQATWLVSAPDCWVVSVASWVSLAMQLGYLSCAHDENLLVSVCSGTRCVQVRTQLVRMHLAETPQPNSKWQARTAPSDCQVMAASAP